ncbi:MAG TPA: 5-(carboxyamino)imidazole ribonucleotide mutase [Phycisphaerae bacterium]|nr:5-(carboxyamino)imidazole ribonucleotide mutase [Phycisphaerae bacterium]
MASRQVAILVGSDSDWAVMEACYKTLGEFGVPVTVRALSAHRTPDQLAAFVRGAEGQGVAVFIAAAGMAAALPGAVAALTSLPVIGVPLISGALQGVDSLLSIVQMPPGVPVATVAVGEPGARNAALLAVQILATADPSLAEAFKKFKSKQAETVDKKNQSLQERLPRG